MSLRVVFMGSPEFSLPALRVLAQAHQVVGVVTQPDRASGRGRGVRPPAVKLLVQELGLQVIQPVKLREPAAMERLRAWSPDLIVVAAFGQILKKEVLDLPRHGCLNLHASLLPRWRGAAPVHAAILAGDELTGVCIMVMEEGLDTGPVLAMQSLRIGPQDTTGCVSEKLSRLGADLLMEALPGYLSGEIVPRPQPAAGVTYAPMLNKEDGLLDFSRPAEELERRVRAMDPWPGAWFEWRGKPLKVSRSSILPHGKQGIGSKFIAGGNPAITTARGALILEELQPAGRRKMSGKAFLAGVKDWDAAQPPDRPAG